MLCIESVNDLVCHAGRLRSTVLMTSYKIVHISPDKRVAWSSKQPKILHITSYFSRNHASQEKTETNTDICIHKVPLRSDYWQLVIGNPLLNLSIRLWEDSFRFDRCVVAVPRSGPADWHCPVKSPTKILPGGRKKIPPVWKIAHQKYVRWDFFPPKFFTRFIPAYTIHLFGACLSSTNMMTLTN